MSATKNTKTPAIEIDYLRLLNILPTDKINSKLNVKGGAAVMSCAQPLRLANTNLLANVYIEQKAKKPIFCLSSLYPINNVMTFQTIQPKEETIGGAPKKPTKKPVVKKPAPKAKNYEEKIIPIAAKPASKKKSNTRKVQSKDENIYQTNYSDAEEYGGSSIQNIDDDITSLNINSKKRQ